MKYDHRSIEKKWRERWEKDRIYQPDLDRAKRPFYNLMMFPYPSAEGLHVGSVFTFTGVDTYGRFKRMQGYDVFEPMGLDGFGIHSENYALKIGKHPKEQAKVSESNFYRQLRSIGNSFDWSRKVETYDPNYYKWTQWIFIQLFKRGLAYRKKAPVNFCPSCKTVLSDEQVITKEVPKVGKVSKVSKGDQEVGENQHFDQRKSQTNEEKLALKVCERCGTEVEIRNLEQWFFKITQYAERLLNNIPKLNWTEKVKIAQRDWIGKKEGARIRFVIASTFDKLSAKQSQEIATSQAPRDDSVIEVFTTRQDTLPGATFIVVAPEHPIVAQLLKIKNQKLNIKNIEEYLNKTKKKTEIERTDEGKEKTGVFSGLYVINPVNNEELPVWVADYALMGYGTGALFGDAHDARDVEFAKKYSIPLKPTLITGDKERDRRILNQEELFLGYGTLVNSGEFSGLTSREALEKVAVWLEKHGKGGKAVNYHLRDWLISRQRYWGAPIPMVFCESCASQNKGYFEVGNEKLDLESLNSGNQDIKKSKSRISHFSHQDDPMYGWFPVPEDQLPVLLPDVEDWKPRSSQSSSGQAISPLASVADFVNTACPNCGEPARRETDVIDTFLDSSWYFFRYLATEWDDVPFPSKAFVQNPKSEIRNPKQIRNQNDQNSKQFRVSSFDIRASAQRAENWLPVTMYIGGAEHAVLHLLYSRFITMVFKDMGLIDFEEPYARFYAHGLIIKEGAKMSKSKGNVVNPDEYLNKYGSDTLRAYLRFVGPFDMGGDFRDSGIEGMHRFINRVWRLIAEKTRNNTQKNAEKVGVVQRSIPHGSAQIMHKTIKGVTEDLENLRFNTSVAKLMTYYNYLSDQKEISHEEAEVFVKLLAPITPFLAEELWDVLGNKFSVHSQSWPTYDKSMLVEDEVTIIVQVNGKVRDQLKVSSKGRSASGRKSQIEQMAMESANVVRHLEGKQVKKVVYVEGKIINFVTASSD